MERVKGYKYIERWKNGGVIPIILGPPLLF